MDVRLTAQPSYTLAYCHLSAGESVLVERDGMVACSSGIDVGAGVGPGGVVKAAMRKQFGGEHFWLGKYTATTASTLMSSTWT